MYFRNIFIKETNLDLINRKSEGDRLSPLIKINPKTIELENYRKKKHLIFCIFLNAYRILLHLTSANWSDSALIVMHSARTEVT